jgi:hypothetical protein
MEGGWDGGGRGGGVERQTEGEAAIQERETRKKAKVRIKEFNNFFVFLIEGNKKSRFFSVRLEFGL